MSETEKRLVEHESLVRHAQALMIEALQLLDTAGAHQSAALLDHAICVLPGENADEQLERKLAGGHNQSV